MAYHSYKHKSGGYYRHRSRYGRYSTTSGCLSFVLMVIGTIILIVALVVI